MADLPSTKAETMIEIAKMYYLDSLSQDVIASRLHMSRSNVSRLLARSVKEGIVQITINDSRHIHTDVAHRICKKFRLEDVIIVRSHSEPDRTCRKAGEAISEYLSECIQNGMLLGVTHGKLAYYASRCIHNTRGAKVDTVQMMGCTLNQSAMQDSYMLTEAFAQRLGGMAHVLPIPLMLKSKQLRDQLLLEPICRDVVERYPSIDVALLEIHSLHVRLSSQFREPWLTKADSLQLSEVHAVASVCGHYFDLFGIPCNAGVNDRIIAADSQTIKNIPHRIGAAVGNHMLEPTLSILRSRLINVLIVDEALAFDIDSTL